MYNNTGDSVNATEVAKILIIRENMFFLVILCFEMLVLEP